VLEPITNPPSLHALISGPYPGSGGANIPGGGGATITEGIGVIIIGYMPGVPGAIIAVLDVLTPPIPDKSFYVTAVVEVT